ncbi:MAG: glycosyltransferase family 4 protein [Actinomycetota bacterium]
MSSRKILLITNDLGPRAGGIETFILGLLDQLDGSEIVIYTAAQEASTEFDLALTQKSGVIIIRDKSSVLIPSPLVNRRIRKVMQAYNSEIVWFGAAMPLAWMSGLLKRAGAKRIVAITHGHEVWWAKLPPFKWILKYSSRSIDVVTYLGEFTKSALAPAISSRTSLVQIAPGIPIDHFVPAPKSQTLIRELNLEGKQIIISVGRLVHRKGQDKLLEALPQILAQHPDVVLVFVGVGPRRKKLDQLVRRFDLTDYVRFIGRVTYDSLPQYFQLSDLFVMPSRSRFAGLEVEGLGIVYLEASACGIPVVAGTSGGAPDAVLQGETGVVVDGTNLAQITDVINDLLDHPVKLKAMGLAGRAWAEERWSWQIWGERFRKLLLGD